MNIDFSSMPSSLDMLHLILALVTALLFVLLLKKPNTENSSLIAEEESLIPDAPIPSSAPEQPAIPQVQLKAATPDSALQLLTLLQQDARFIDFVKEDLSDYSDADIGAAARVVHEGSKKTLDTYFTLDAIRSEDEETRISLPAGFNASEVRLTGNVVGEAPFNGTLVHKGWKVSEAKLPKISEGHDSTIVAPAEVEL